MSVYKVPQDVEAEDKFLGPLSFKQFIFFGGVIFCLFLFYQAFSSGFPYLSLIVLPFFIVCMALAFPWTKDQPTELWLASRIRFFLVPRRRIWDQEGIEDHVTITAPKREVHVYTDGLNQDQVKSRLSALASLVDSKGWATKDPTHADDYHSDRLINNREYTVDPLQQHDTVDVLDDVNGQLAQHMSSLITESEQKRRSETQSRMQSVAPGSTVQPSGSQPSHSPWFLQQQPLEQPHADLQNMQSQQRQTQNTAFLDKVQQAQAAQQPASPTLPQPAQTPLQQQTDQQAAYGSSVAPTDPAIMALSKRDDLNVSTIARQANVYNVSGNDEVVVSLHNNKNEVG